MKKLLPAFLFLLACAACKKDSQTQPDPAGADIVKTGNGVPILGSLSPNVVTAGMTVSLAGLNLPSSASAIKVSLNGVDAPVRSSSPSGLVIQVPVTSSGGVKAVIGDQTLNGPTFTYVAAPAISSMSPATVTTGSVVTLTGTNFQAVGLNTTVSFNGVTAVIQSITPTEIKVVAPKTANGKVTVALTPGITAVGPAYVYVSPGLLTPYVSGDVSLASQSDVDVFTTMNKGRQLQITGDLNLLGADITSVAGLSNITSVSGRVYMSYTTALTEAPFLNSLTQAGSIYLVSAGLTRLSLNSLRDFKGGFYLFSLTKLAQISFNGLETPAYISIDNSPLLSDLSFLNRITATGSITLYTCGGAALQADNLQSTSSISLYYCPDLALLSFRSLSAITGDNISGLIVSGCTALAKVRFDALTSITGQCTFSATALTDMNGFSTLKRAGALTLTNNNALADLQGLKELSALTLPAVTSAARAGSLKFNGIDIEFDPKLTSLNGLQNVSTLPILTIQNNAALNDLCPLKKQLLALNALPAYTYRYTPCCDAPVNSFVPGSRAALTLSANGTYAGAQNVLNALCQCP